MTNNILFFGTYQHKVDSKGRVSIPAKWRRHLIENCLYQFEEYFFNSIDSALNWAKSEDIYPRLYKHNLDTEGRAVFKQEKGKTAILKGCGDYFEIKFIE